MKISRALNDDRLMKAVIGMSVNEFQRLGESFEKELEAERQSEYEKEFKNNKRQRKPGGGRRGVLKEAQEKLFFILFYFKCYPTFDVLGLFFDLNRSNTCRNAHYLTRILEKSLGRKMVLPERKIHSVEELLEIFPDVKELIIDGTERPIQRPKDKDKQKKNYSGKKKRHTRKNILITDKNKRIGYLSPTIEGKKHDYALFKDEFPLQNKPPPKAVLQKLPTFHTDLGFVGIEKDYSWMQVKMPKKKSKGKELTEDEKASNKEKSGFRVRVEHAIGGAKRYGIVSDIFRNKCEEFNDKVMSVACGLWNYHLGQA